MYGKQKGGEQESQKGKKGKADKKVGGETFRGEKHTVFPGS